MDTPTDVRVVIKPFNHALKPCQLKHVNTNRFMFLSFSKLCSGAGVHPDVGGFVTRS